MILVFTVAWVVVVGFFHQVVQGKHFPFHVPARSLLDTLNRSTLPIVWDPQKEYLIFIILIPTHPHVHMLNPGKGGDRL